MLTLITGTPGGGKTLLTVSTIIPEFAKQILTMNDELGQPKVIPRRILVDGIKDLVVEHELLSPTKIKTELHGRESSEVIYTDGEGVANWWEWCKPGDVIVIDEVQRIWRPRGNGSKVPEMIAQLETHRHRGVDFVLITQHPMLLDQNVRRLVGRHIHVRRMWGGSRAVRYEWDHCSSPDKVGDAGKSYWPYPKDAFKYYKSAEIHTKQGGRAPAALIILAGSMLALPFIAYYSVSGVQGLLHPVANAATLKDKPVGATTTSQAPPVAKFSLEPPKAAASAAESTAAAADAAEPPATLRASYKIQGCIAMPTRCSCFDAEGIKAQVTDDQCRLATSEVGVLVPLKTGT